MRKKRLTIFTLICISMFVLGYIFGIILSKSTPNDMRINKMVDIERKLYSN